MSYADKIFKDMCTNILENGTDTKGEKVRPIWTDTGEKAYTIKQFGIANKYDLRKEFPATTLRKTGIKSAFDEILWIYQRKSNNIKDLKPHIWDEWADENGSIGNAYGYQVGKQFLIKRFVNEPITSFLNFIEPIKNYPSFKVVHNNEYLDVYLDQMDNLLYGLKEQPFGRRHMISLWNVDELHEMHLNPCCWSCNFVVTNEDNKLTLNLVLNQRSNDVLAANNWNVCQYALLLMMVAQVSGMVPGTLLHVIADAHIYDRHIPMIKELIQRKEFDAPTVKLDPNIKNFYEFNYDSITVENYNHGEQIINIPIAV